PFPYTTLFRSQQLLVFRRAEPPREQPDGRGGEDEEHPDPAEESQGGGVEEADVASHHRPSRPQGRRARVIRRRRLTIVASDPRAMRVRATINAIPRRFSGSKIAPMQARNRIHI